MKNEGGKIENNKDVDGEFGRAANHIVMFLVVHFRIVKEELISIMNLLLFFKLLIVVFYTIKQKKVIWLGVIIGKT